MKKLDISPDLEEKIYDLKNDGNNILKITTYFPLKLEDKLEILKSVEKTQNSPVDFKSIFSDDITEQDWIHSREQIKKKFHDELMKID